MEKNYVIGVDYGTDSVRSVIIDTANGAEIAAAVFYYPRWKAGLYCNPAQNQFRQHPLDYTEGLEATITECLKKAPHGTAQYIRGISVDTTGSTPVAVNQQGVPLALTEECADDPDGMFILWKDHTSVAEAEAINHTARSWGGVDFTQYVGGVYSSEWFWAKLLHVIRHNKTVRTHAYSWVEHCDWISACLTGNTDPIALKRSRCAAGHKAMWHKNFGGLPSNEFLVKIDPLLDGLTKRLFNNTYTSNEKMGTLSSAWASKLGLSPNVVIGVGAFDAHMGAVGGGIAPRILSKAMGTSTCDTIVAPNAEIGDRLIKGICGQVDGSIIPGMTGLEAGQSAFGDIYAWFADVLAWPVQMLQKTGYLSCTSAADLPAAIISGLSEQAAALPVGASGIIAVDWMNGRRTPYANQALKGALMDLNLASSAPKIFRALVEATAFGAKKIVDCFTEQGVAIEGVIALGGVAKKSPFVMQIVADILGIPIQVARSEQACALGAAMFAAVTSGVYSTVQEAQQKMSNGFEVVYTPNKKNEESYRVLYAKYNSASAFIEKQTKE